MKFIQIPSSNPFTNIYTETKQNPNMSPEQMRQAVTHRDAAGLSGKVLLEASGGITLENVRQAAETGVERIALGALTHSARAVDIALDIEV